MLCQELTAVHHQEQTTGFPIMADRFFRSVSYTFIEFVSSFHVVLSFSVLLVFTHVINRHFFNENKRKLLHNNRVKFPEDLICLIGAPTWPPFLCLGAPTWRP